MSIELPSGKAALQRAAALLGGQAALASVCQYTDRRHVWPWFNTERQVPEEKCPLIERATRDKGEAVVCEVLRPDVNWIRIPHEDWPTGKPVIDPTRDASDSRVAPSHPPAAAAA